MSSKSCLDRVKQTEDEGKTSHLKKFNLTDKTRSPTSNTVRIYLISCTKLALHNMRLSNPMRMLLIKLRTQWIDIYITVFGVGIVFYFVVLSTSP